MPIHLLALLLVLSPCHLVTSQGTPCFNPLVFAPDYLPVGGPLVSLASTTTQAPDLVQHLVHASTGALGPATVPVSTNCPSKRLAPSALSAAGWCQLQLFQPRLRNQTK